VEARLTENNNS